MSTTLSYGIGSLLNPGQRSPETMGAVCAVVYLFAIIVFIPFPFYKDIVAATSGGGNRDVMVEHQELETGRILHLFPHSKVTAPTKWHSGGMLILLLLTAGFLPIRHPVFAIRCSLGHRRRLIRYSVAP